MVPRRPTEVDPTRKLEGWLLRRRVLLNASLKKEMKQRWARQGEAANAGLQSRREAIRREIGRIDAALSKEVSRLRCEDPASVERWADLHMALLTAVLADEALDSVARDVAEREQQAWQKVRAGDLQFVEENVFYINFHGPLYDESFGEVEPSTEFEDAPEAQVRVDPPAAAVVPASSPRPRTAAALAKQLRLDPNIAQALLVEGDAMERRGDLVRALQDGSGSEIKSLLAAGPVSSTPDGNGNTPLNLALLLCPVARCKALLRSGADPNGLDGHGLSPLNIATTVGEGPKIALLKQAGADPNLPTKHGYTPLHQAAEIPFPRANKIIRLLLKAGADIEAVEDQGRTPLQVACLALPFHHALKPLIQAGADLDKANAQGITALFRCAITANELRVDAWRSEGSIRGKQTVYTITRGKFEYFSDGAKRSIAAKDIRLIARRWCHDHFKYLHALEGVKMLIKAGADVDRTTHSGRSAVHLLCRIGEPSLLRMIGKAGANFNQPGKAGASPLAEAVHSGRIDAVQVLLKAGVDIDAADDGGWTALHAAAAAGDAELVGHLLRAGADRRFKTTRGTRPHLAGPTAADVARAAGHEAVAEQLDP